MLDYYDLTEEQQRAEERYDRCCAQVAAIEEKLQRARVHAERRGDDYPLKKWRFHLRAAEKGRRRAADALR